MRVHMSACVQVFGRRDDEAIPALMRPAAEKRQGTKSREVGYGAGQRALWGFDAGADLDGAGDVGWMRPACLHAGEVGNLQWAFRRALGAHQRAIGALIAVIWSREIVAGVEPAHRNGEVATLTRSPAHDESILLGVGRHLGSQSRAKTSMTIMRAPQRGHGQGSTRGASGVPSGCCCGSTAGGATSRSARAVAILSARLAEAKSP